MSLPAFFAKIAVAALLVLAIPAGRAGERPPSSSRTNSPDWEKRREEWNKLSPEEREERAKEWERRREEYRKMTPEQREAKRKELENRLAKRIAELQEKQVNGKITPEEKRELERRKQILKRFQQGPGGPPKEPGSSPPGRRGEPHRRPHGK